MRVSNVNATTIVAALAVGGMVLTAPGVVKASAPGTTSQGRVAAQSVSVPTPKSFFGFEMGAEGKLAAFDQIKAYLKLIADKSPRVDYEVVGQTTEGEDFPILRVSSKKNLDRIEQILAINARLSDPKAMQAEATAAGMSRDDYARRLAATSVPVYYIEAGIHSTEVGNTQALMNVVHRFATEDSAFTKRALDSMVMLVVPSQNPDGHNRVINYFNQTAGTDYARVFPDLYQKYVGHDDNRDWFMFTQKESQIRVKLEQKYRPAVQHYMHWAGTNSPRIWSPPWDEPMSPTLDPLTVASANSIGQEANRDLTAAGKKGAKVDDAYGIMWNADVMGYSTFQGTTTWLTEIASVKDLAYTFTSDKILEPSVATLRSPQPYDSKTWTLKQTVQYAETALYSGVDSVAGNPQEWLYNNMYLVNSHSETWKGGPNAYVIPANQRDPYAVYDMLKIFNFGKVEIDQATKPFRAAGKWYPRGSWILRTNQPLGRWVDQLLRIDQYPDSARKCSTCPLVLPYSETTDNLGLLMGVKVDSVKDDFAATTSRVTDLKPAQQRFPQQPGAKGAYVLSPTSYGLGMVMTDLEKAGVPMYRATQPVPVFGATLPPGSVLVPAKNAKARATLMAASAKTGLPVYARQTAPKTPAIQLKATTRVGLVRGANNMPGGWLMWMMEQFGVDYQVVTADDYKNLGAKFDTVVLAPGISTTSITDGLDPAKYPKQFHWAKGVPDGPAKLKAFVNGGGNLVALGSASTTAVSALDLPAQNITPTDRNAFSAPGSLLKQSFRPRVPAAWGMPTSWPVWFNNNPSFKLTGRGQIASSYPQADDLLVSGYAKGTQAISGATNIATFKVGSGQATIAGADITFRTWPRATWTVVTNAMYNGAGSPLTAKEMVAKFR